MSSIVNTLLEELYTLEPGLRTKESDVRNLIEDMVANQPQVEISETFRKELRTKIMHEIAENQKPSWNWWPMVSFACLCLVVGVWFSAEKNIISPTPVAFEKHHSRRRKKCIWTYHPHWNYTRGSTRSGTD